MEASRRPRSELEQIFYDDCPPEWRIGMLQALNEAYEATRSHCRPPMFGLNEARDVYGHHLRGVFETEWRRLASNFPGLASESRANSRSSSFHTWVKIGRIFLTASSVRQKGQKPQSANFRNTYARTGQLELDLFGELPCLDNVEVYAIFLYGPLQAIAPSIATVAFPDKDWKSYKERIDLIAIHPGTINIPSFDDLEVQEEPIPEIRVSPEETIQEPGYPGLRPNRPRITGGEREQS